MRVHGIDIDRLPWMVAAAAIPKTSTAPPKNPASRRCGRKAASALGVFIVPPPPGAGFIASLRRTVQPLVHPPYAVQSPREGRVGVVEDTLDQREGAHAGSLARVGG